jgi:TetR/AcrR family transcriptional regulator, transcriptional repressor for nem operon
MDTSPAARRGPKPNPDTRSKLLQAGLQMMHAEGYAASGIQSIVERVAVPKGSFYNHFASKETFTAEVIDAYFDRGQAKLRKILGNPDIPALERLEAYFDDLIDVFRTSKFTKGCLLGNISAEVADHSALMRQHLAAHFAAWSGYFEKCIAEGQDQGTISNQFPAPSLGRFVLNSWEGALLRMRAEKSAVPLVEFKEIVFGKLLVK